MGLIHDELVHDRHVIALMTTEKREFEATYLQELDATLGIPINQARRITRGSFNGQSSSRSTL